MSSTSPTSNTTIDSFDLRRAAVINSTRATKNVGRQSARDAVGRGIEGLITALREGTEALRPILLPKRQLAELLRTKPFEKIDRHDRRSAAKELRKIGVAEINYFLSKDTEDQVKRIESIVRRLFVTDTDEEIVGPSVD